jgi:hypothetical protein
MSSVVLRPRVSVAWVLGSSSVLVLRFHVVTALSVLLSHCLCFALRASFLIRSQCSVLSKVLDPAFLRSWVLESFAFACHTCTVCAAVASLAVCVSRSSSRRSQHSVSSRDLGCGLGSWSWSSFAFGLPRDKSCVTHCTRYVAVAAVVALCYALGTCIHVHLSHLQVAFAFYVCASHVHCCLGTLHLHVALAFRVCAFVPASCVLHVTFAFSRSHVAPTFHARMFALALRICALRLRVTSARCSFRRVLFFFTPLLVRATPRRLRLGRRSSLQKKSLARGVS